MGVIMRKFLLATCVVLFAVPALAADLPFPGKAPYAFTAYPSKGCGPYYGLGIGGTGNAVNGAPAGDTMLGGNAGILLGYTCTNGSGGYWFGEGRISAQGLSGTTINSAANTPLMFQEKFAFGGPLPQFFTGIFPNLTIPAVGSLAPLPGGVTVVGPAMPYLYVAADQNDISAQFPGLGSGREWEASFELGVGMLNRLSDAVVSDTSAGLILQSLGNGICIGPVTCPKVGLGAAVQQSFKF